ncbi:hypothetical protein G6F51_014683 [Rhizopus arrhizus]|uniref:Uncharacterized protein n=1 Tax=Rhizopus oryzae TaxID=64495 RepID=A0A9P6XL89_RHIOR|nr:hypothetical protein G6F51_014683 [Rhizopus arrhizus]
MISSPRILPPMVSRICFRCWPYTGRTITRSNARPTAPATSMLDSTTSDSVKWLVMMGAMMAGANRPPKRATAPAMPMPLARRAVG